jgi:hypothetical protein
MAMMRGGQPGPATDMGAMASKLPVILHEAKGKNGRKFVVQGSASVGSEMGDGALEYMTKGRSGIDTKPK